MLFAEAYRIEGHVSCHLGHSLSHVPAVQALSTLTYKLNKAPHYYLNSTTRFLRPSNLFRFMESANASEPDHVQGAGNSTSDTPAPSSFADVQSLLDAYVASYTDILTPNSTRMSHAKAFALALLQRHYPASEDFLIHPSALGPMAGHGLNFMLKSADGTSPNCSLEPPKPAKRGKKAT
jgi:hypothetical protein